MAIGGPRGKLTVGGFPTTIDIFTNSQGAFEPRDSYSPSTNSFLTRAALSQNTLHPAAQRQMTNPVSEVPVPPGWGQDALERRLPSRKSDIKPDNGGSNTNSGKFIGVTFDPYYRDQGYTNYDPVTGDLIPLAGGGFDTTKVGDNVTPGGGPQPDNPFTPGGTRNTWLDNANELSGGNSIPFGIDGDVTGGDVTGGDVTGGDDTGGRRGQSDLVDIFQPDKYPSSWSGLPPEFRDQLLTEILPQLSGSVKDYKSDIDKSTKAAQELYQSQTRSGMKSGLQGILNSLAGRNMLNSTVASDAIGRGMGDIIRGGAEKGYETSMLNAGLKAQFPELLTKIASLGQGSFNSNPLAPYELLAQYDWNMD